MHCAADILGRCERNLMSHSDRSFKKQNTKRNVDSESPNHEISGGDKRSISSQAIGRSHSVLAKILTAFCLCPKN